jgi:DNA mismatch repair protein MutS2
MIEEASPEYSFIWDDTARSHYYSSIPIQFRTAAQKLDLAEIVASHINLATTIVGKHALVDELIPSMEVKAITTSLAEIEELRIFLGANEHPSFSGIRDIRNLLHKIEIEGSTIYEDEGLPLLETFRGMRLLRDFFAKRSRQAPTLWKTAVLLFDDRMLEMALDSVFEANGTIKDSASPELRSIRREIITTSERLRVKLASLMKRYSDDALLQEELITQREGRFVVPVKAEHKRHVAGMIHSASQTGQTIYIEPAETIELNNELRSLEFDERREIDRILRNLTDRMREAVPKLFLSLNAASHLDAVYGKTRYAVKISAASPNIKSFPKPQDVQLSLKSARHPFLIEKLGLKNTVPFDIDMDRSKHTLVLTGPNAGGKTVLLKSIGIILLMAQCGLPIPALPDAIVPVMEHIGVDIGDSQSIADDLSTFSSHINSLKKIIEETNEYSLILLDEIGSGTAPEEGGALVEALLEYLTKQGCLTVATTHFGRLAAFAETVEGAFNGSMEFNEKDLQPTYRFRAGVPGSSHAFDIAERYKFPQRIISRARELVGAKTSRLDELISSLNAKEQELLEKRMQIDKELGKSRIERMDYERKASELTLQRKKLLADASQEADKLLADANLYIERAVREAREAAKVEAIQPKHEKTVNLAELRSKQKQELEALTARVEEHKVESQKVPVPVNLKLEVGAKVRLVTNPGQVGEIVKLKDKDAEVVFGSMTMKVNTDKLEVISSGEARKDERAQARFGGYYEETIEQRIDLRGLYGDEGVMKVEKYIADAAAKNLDHVEIIHGHGTGALGRRIQDSLRKNPFVKSFRYGEPAEGGSGVTIVVLK